MRHGERNLYNVYLNGHMIATKLSSTQVEELTGCSRNAVSIYAKRGGKHMAAEGIYTFAIAETVQKEEAKPTNPYERDKPIKMPPKWAREWDETRIKILKACGRVTG